MKGRQIKPLAEILSPQELEIMIGTLTREITLMQEVYNINIEHYKAVLEFYGDAKNYEKAELVDMYGEVYSNFNLTMIQIDKGKKARMALTNRHKRQR